MNNPSKDFLKPAQLDVISFQALMILKLVRYFALNKSCCIMILNLLTVNVIVTNIEESQYKVYRSRGKDRELYLLQLSSSEGDFIGIRKIILY